MIAPNEDAYCQKRIVSLLKSEEKTVTKRKMPIGPNKIVRPRTISKRGRLELVGFNPLSIRGTNLPRDRHHD